MPTPKSRTRRQSQRLRLSRLVLAHESRQAQPWLIFDVRLGRIDLPLGSAWRDGAPGFLCSCSKKAEWHRKGPTSADWTDAE